MSQAADAVAAWLAELAEQRRLSPHTISNYRRDLDKLLSAAGATPLAELHGQQIRRFIGQMHAQGLGGRSLARTLSAWRGFFAWLGRRGAVPANPCEGVRSPKSPKLLPKALSVDEVNRLLEPVADDDSLLAARDTAMFELFYSSGLRLAELAALDRDALDSILHEGEVRVLGKRSKARIVPVGRMAQRALAAWAEVRDQLAGADEVALFVGQRGRRISHRVIEDRLAKRAVQLGLPRHVHPHMLRHSFASHVLQSSGDLRAVQEMLGHASIASTQVYTHLDFQHLARTYDAAHPRAKRKP
ncbi:tyrosine recombinase XerC [Quatrionicoccus australiensis]|uniref:tyrosine recombinase XerC n=1 Tax=Quatrionicoccus australiensis TaxID=138118 RepID=UPI001CFAD643|nr:tyrosine recombinase XerC [Quatrionicoccus australiensis]MCB4360219.1 tyrosine recombinase XerC [Quatrionicoccus australiensis]